MVKSGFVPRKTESVLSTILLTASFKLSAHWVSHFGETFILMEIQIHFRIMSHEKKTKAATWVRQMEKLPKSACSEIIHHHWSGPRGRPHKTEGTSAKPSWMIRHQQSMRQQRGMLATLYGSLFAYKLQVQMSPSHWRNSHQTPPATQQDTIAWPRWGLIALLRGFRLTSPKP